MSTSQKIRITRYGLSIKAGGWDPDGDSSTDDWIGNHNNHLSSASCAVSPSAKALLGCVNGDILDISFDIQREQLRRVDDTAPEGSKGDLDEPHIDLFYPWKDDPTLPDYAMVRVFPS